MPTPEPDFDAVAIIRALNDHGVDYIVVGGFAVAAWGVIRATDDLDIVVDQSWNNAAHLAEALTELNARDATDAPTPLTQETLVRRENRLFSTKHGQVHILNHVGTVPSYGELLPAQLVEVDDLRVRVATKDQLRSMKTGTGRPKDALDLDELGETDAP
jgi:hypothetical protein